MRRTQLVAGVGAWLAVATLVAVVLGLAHRRLGLVVLVVLFGLVPSQIGFALGRRVATGVVAAVAGTLVLPLVVLATPVPRDRLERVLDELEGPSLHAVESGTGGTQLCIDGCPSVDRLYLVAADSTSVRRAISEHATTLGFRLSETSVGVLTGSSGRVRLKATITERGSSTQLLLRASAR